jgi:hypothetical protein
VYGELIVLKIFNHRGKSFLAAARTRSSDRSKIDAAVYLGDHFSVTTLADHYGRCIGAIFSRVPNHNENALMPDCSDHLLAALEAMQSYIFIDGFDIDKGKVCPEEVVSMWNDAIF